MAGVFYFRLKQYLHFYIQRKARNNRSFHNDGMMMEMISETEASLCGKPVYSYMRRKSGSWWGRCRRSREDHGQSQDRTSSGESESQLRWLCLGSPLLPAFHIRRFLKADSDEHALDLGLQTPELLRITGEATEIQILGPPLPESLTQ